MRTDHLNGRLYRGVFASGSGGGCWPLGPGGCWPLGLGSVCLWVQGHVYHTRWTHTHPGHPSGHTNPLDTQTPWTHPQDTHTPGHTNPFHNTSPFHITPDCEQNDWQTGVKTLPSSKLRLRVVIMLMLAQKDFRTVKKLPPVGLDLMITDQESSTYPTELTWHECIFRSIFESAYQWTENYKKIVLETRWLWYSPSYVGIFPLFVQFIELDEEFWTTWLRPFLMYWESVNTLGAANDNRCCNWCTERVQDPFFLWRHWLCVKNVDDVVDVDAPCDGQWSFIYIPLLNLVSGGSRGRPPHPTAQKFLNFISDPVECIIHEILFAFVFLGWGWDFVKLHCWLPYPTQTQHLLKVYSQKQQQSFRQ